MKRTITLLMCMAFALLLTAVAQSITHTFSDVSMSDALKYLQQHTSRYKIVFIYDDLEDYKVTTTVKNKSVPDAIRQMIGFYPIKMTRKENREIYVEAILKTERRLKGVVVDEHNLPMPYANVTLLSPADSSICRLQVGLSPVQPRQRGHHQDAARHYRPQGNRGDRRQDAD